MEKSYGRGEEARWCKGLRRGAGGSVSGVRGVRGRAGLEGMGQGGVL